MTRDSVEVACLVLLSLPFHDLSDGCRGPWPEKGHRGPGRLLNYHVIDTKMELRFSGGSWGNASQRSPFSCF